jgi:hypothetical protein
MIIDFSFGGKFLGGVIQSRYAHLGANRVENSEYDDIEDIFREQIQPDDVLVDVGCGVGRVINGWLYQGHTGRIVGLELDPVIGERTKRRLAKYHNVTIIVGDAIENLPCDGTVFFMFNPFNEAIIERFKQRFSVIVAPQRNPRIFYYNPKHVTCFTENTGWQVEWMTLRSTARFQAVKITHQWDSIPHSTGHP